MSDSIQHIIVLMLENRSFDHFFGAVPNVDGVDPNNPGSNLEGPGSANVYRQEAVAVRKMKPDPRHETKNVLRQIDPTSSVGWVALSMTSQFQNQGPMKRGGK